MDSLLPPVYKFLLFVSQRTARTICDRRESPATRFSSGGPKLNRTKLASRDGPVRLFPGFTSKNCPDEPDPDPSLCHSVASVALFAPLMRSFRAFGPFGLSAFRVNAFRAHSSPMLAAARRYFTDESDAADAVQDASRPACSAQRLRRF